jgi:tyrosinase
VPFKQWDNATGSPGHEMMGYCPHTSSIFGSWHRPYLALFEQVLHDRAVDVANEYPIGQAHNRAMELANRVRLPYWDWAMNPPNSTEGVIPSSLRDRMVTINCPNGTVSEVQNPLYRYDFHPLESDVFAPLVSSSLPVIKVTYTPQKRTHTDLHPERIRVQRLESNNSLPARSFRCQRH